MHETIDDKLLFRESPGRTAKVKYTNISEKYKASQERVEILEIFGVRKCIENNEPLWYFVADTENRLKGWVNLPIHQEYLYENRKKIQYFKNHNLLDKIRGVWVSGKISDSQTETFNIENLVFAQSQQAFADMLSGYLYFYENDGVVFTYGGDFDVAFDDVISKIEIIENGLRMWPLTEGPRYKVDIIFISENKIHIYSNQKLKDAPAGYAGKYTRISDKDGYLLDEYKKIFRPIKNEEK